MGISYICKEYSEFKLGSDKHSEGVSIEKTVKTTKQILFHKGLFNNYVNASEVLKEHLLFEVNGRRRPGLEEANDVIQ